MQAYTGTENSGAGIGLGTRLRRAKYADRGEAVALCLLAAEELDKMSYDLAAMKSMIAGMAASAAENGRTYAPPGAPRGRHGAPAAADFFSRREGARPS